MATLEVDGRGNFYTTESINWTAGLYPVVQSDQGFRYMVTPTTTGACNSCHDGSSQSRIYAD